MTFATINGLTLHYRRTGASAGVPLILANSLGTDARIWDDVLPVLGKRFAIVTYDKRGHGLSDAPPGPYGIDDHAADLVALADHCGFERFVMGGVSVGGMIAMRVAATQPQRVRALVLCDTAAQIGSAQMWNERIAQVEAAGIASISEAILARWLSPGYRAAQPAHYTGWRNMLERCDRAGYAATCATVRDADLHDDLARITAPTLVVAGENDMSTPPDMVRPLANAIANARFALIAGAGHIPSIEQPDVLAATIDQFLKEVVDA
ncbi:MAG: 3-oxoadipate enol-lactonase [Alphaproteobacteria bacterium]|nr:3-oxoadipate enol-lactonase [Alphaproteobacteria bacterium]